MDTKEAGAKGGRISRANMDKEALRKAVSKAGQSSWKNHKKGDDKCVCKQCAARKK